MNETGQLLMQTMLLVILIGLAYWFLPRQCKHCGQWVIPGSRYVWHDPFGYGYTHFALHDRCAEKYFDHLREHPAVSCSTEKSIRDKPEETSQKNLKPIPEFGRFLLDESWIGILVLVGVPMLVLTKSFLWAGTIGLIAATGTRLVTMLTLRFVFKVNPQIVKPHRPFGM